MTEEQVLRELMEAFEGDHLSEDNAPGKKDGQVTLDEFMEYYTGVSSS